MKIGARIWRWLLTPTHEVVLKIMTVVCLVIALAMIGLVIYQGAVIAQQKEVIDWIERTFLSRPV